MADEIAPEPAAVPKPKPKAKKLRARAPKKAPDPKQEFLESVVVAADKARAAGVQPVRTLFESMMGQLAGAADTFLSGLAGEAAKKPKKKGKKG